MLCTNYLMEYNLKEVILGNQNVRFVYIYIYIYIYILTMHADNSSRAMHTEISSMHLGLNNCIPKGYIYI